MPVLLLLCPFILHRNLAVMLTVTGVFLYCLQIVRIIRREVTLGRPLGYASEISLFLMLGKFPQLLGVAGFFLQRIRRLPSRIIEYKT